MVTTRLAAQLLVAAAWAGATGGVDSTIVGELGPMLSEGAAVMLPSSPGAEELLGRAAGPRISPDFAAIVEVATEADVQQTIWYANRHGMPFLTVSGAHGWPTTLNRARGAIQINMRRMNHTRLKPDAKTAIVGGGTLQHELTAALFLHGRQAVTGGCGCVSAIGPLLGGGHSFLQGRYGFAADSLVSARVVLANGSAVDASADQHPDLFWALRGAGHNLGVVASFELRTYDARAPWTMTTLSFTHDKVEAFFDKWNELEDGREERGLLVLHGVMGRNDSLDTDRAVINLQLLYEGETAAAKYAAGFRALGPAADWTVSNIPWGDLTVTAGFGRDSPVCHKDLNLLAAPSSVDRWDPARMRRAFDILSQLTDDAKFAQSGFVLESYGWQGVEAVPDEETAVAPEERRRHILTSPVMRWAGDDAADRDKAERYSLLMQTAVRGPEPPHAYVNYAVGVEGLGEVYGWDEARLERLRSVKRQYDGDGRFGFYMPVSQAFRV